MSDRLTIPDYKAVHEDGSVTTLRTFIDGEAVREHAWELYKRLKQYEDACFADPDENTSNEVITPTRLRELAEDEAKGRSTGFPDRNGTSIREHDIVRVTFLDRCSGKEYLREECEVIFAHGAFGFMWGTHKEFCTLCSFCVGTVVFYEIIGHADRALSSAGEGAE